MLGHVHDGIHGDLGVGLDQAGERREGFSERPDARAPRTAPRTVPRAPRSAPHSAPQRSSPPDLLQDVIPGDVLDVFLHD